MSRAASDTRARLLDAAADVVRHDGARALTLDAVAAQAGVSKGGLLYHFPSKHELLVAIVDQWSARFEQAVATRDDGSPRGWLRAYVRATAEDSGSEPERLLGHGLIAAVVEDPELLALLRSHFERWHGQAVAALDGDETTAALVRIAVDGLWWADLLGLAPPRGRQREALVARVLELAG